MGAQVFLGGPPEQGGSSLAQGSRIYLLRKDAAHVPLTRTRIGGRTIFVWPADRTCGLELKNHLDLCLTPRK